MNRIQRQQYSAKIRLAAKHADAIAKALRSSVDVQAIAEEFFAAHDTAALTTQEARTWAYLHINPKTAELKKALTNLYAASYVIGSDIALASIARVSITKAPTMTAMRNAQAIDWNDWKPGNRAAAALIRPKNGLRSILESRDVTISGMSRTTIDRIGTQLAYALQNGLSPRSVSPAIADLLGAPSPQRTAYLVRQGYKEIDVMLRDPERALMIAQTEMSRAASIAAREMYQDSGVELVEWLTADPCDECQENEDVSPIPIDGTFPSGDTEPPAHPNCVCSLSPYVVDTRGIGDEALSYLLDNQGEQ
jgi:hypothetical protein